MFWKYNTASSVQIDTLLQQENVSLQELMEEEELLQECKAQNKKVVNFLTQPEVLEELVSLLVTDPSPDRELQMRFKYANLASELLTCDVPEIVDKVASSSNLLLMLYKFLEKEKPLNPLLASFVSKVFGMLVQRRSEQNWYSYQFTCFQVLDFLKSQGDFVQVAVKHIGTSAVMDLLAKLICGVDDDDQEIKRGIHQWLNECQLIEQLIEKLTPDCDSEEHCSVDQLLCEIVSTGQDATGSGSDSQTSGSQSRLLTTLESKEMINKLMDTLLHEDRSESSVSHVINILLTLLSFKGSYKQSNLPHMISLEGLTSYSLDSRSAALITILSRLPDLQKILMQPTQLGTLITSYGIEVERLGSTRLKVVNLIAMLIATQDIHVHSEMARLRTFELLFDLFFKFSLNNFLHSEVTRCATCVLTNLPVSEGMADGMDGLNNNPLRMENGEQATDEGRPLHKEEEETGEGERPEKAEGALIKGTTQHPLLFQLFSECSIIQKILECYSEEETASDEKTEHNKVGYMGHIREIANTIVLSANEGVCSPIISSEMQKLPNDVISQWEDFTLITLAELNLKNKIIPLQSFRDGDMDSIGDMRFVDDFKLTDEDGFKLTDEDGINGGQCLDSQLPSGSDALGMTTDDKLQSRAQKFDEICAERGGGDISMFDEIWKDKEQNISFGSLQKSEEEEDENVHSSSEEEGGDFDDEFDALRRTDDKMEVDFASEALIQILRISEVLTKDYMAQLRNKGEWSEVFDKRGNPLSMDSGFNPWQSAPASDTGGSNSWADFGSSPVKNSDPFIQSDDQGGSGFSVSSANSQPVAEFQADFSTVVFSNQQPEIFSTEARFPVDFAAEPTKNLHAEELSADYKASGADTGAEVLQDVYDVSHNDESRRQISFIRDGMEQNESRESASAELECLSGEPSDPYHSEGGVPHTESLANAPEEDPTPRDDGHTPSTHTLPNAAVEGSPSHPPKVPSPTSKVKEGELGEIVEEPQFRETLVEEAPSSE